MKCDKGAGMWLEMVAKYDGKEGIFKAQHPSMLAILHLLMQIETLLFLGFYDFAYVGSCGATLLEDRKCWFLWRQHTFVFLCHILELQQRNINEDK